MNIAHKIKDLFKQFKPTSWVIDHTTVAYVATIAITLWGLNIFTSLPKEQYPDITLPQIYVATVYAGNSPKDVENLITRPIEKQIKAISGAKIRNIKSTSIQDFSSILVEFETTVDVETAKRKVKDAVDKAKTDLPADMTTQPDVVEVAFSDFPIMFVNVSGNYDGVKLKEYAKKLQDKFEELPEVSKAEIAGAPEREIQVNVDKYKMEAAGLGFTDIANAISSENRDITAGNIKIGEMQPTIQVRGQFKTALDMHNIVIKNIYGQPIYLRDIAQVVDTVKEKESYSRLNKKDVVTLQIVKRSGENLIRTSEQVHAIIDELKKSEFPKDLDISVSGDQSTPTKISFNELINTIVIGFLFVLIVLMFFMGVSNAFFVALSVPLSVFVAFLFIPSADVIVGTKVTLNFIVLFALLFGLGIIVDDAIVVIENTHRIFNNGKTPIIKAAKLAAGEVFAPVLSGTVTTLAPFFPLLFWPGIIGKFMIYLPTMLILTLTASLIVAFLINPVFATSFMKPEHYPDPEPKSALFKKKWFWALVGFGLLFHLFRIPAFANFLLIMAVLVIFNTYLLTDWIHRFQNKFLPRIMSRYERGIKWALSGNRPGWLLASVFASFLVGLVALIASIFTGRTKTDFFPSGDPPVVYVYLKMPVGTKTVVTDSVTRILENKVFSVLGENNPIVESVITNVAVGATDPFQGERGTQPHLGRIQISFVEFEKRHGIKTSMYVDSLRSVIKEIPGAEVSIQGQQNGPASGAPVNIEVIGDEFDDIVKTAVKLKNYLDSVNVPGVEKLKLDVDVNKPELTLTVDRERAMREGLSTGQIGGELRTALFGREASKLKDGEDEYKVQIRYTDELRNSISDLQNMKITYRDFSSGQVKQVPISNVVKFDYTNTLGGVKRKNLKRLITVYSNILQGSDPNKINLDVKKAIDNFNGKPDSITIKQTGQQEEQQESLSFLLKALVIALGMIFGVLVLQFNSVSKPFIVLNEIFFSIIGVLFGFALTGMKMPLIMVAMGIVGLAGIVVKNAILLIEFTDELRGRGYKTKDAIIQAGKIRIIPVLLTALATILGLLPLAIGLNIDWLSFLRTFNPHIFLGGDSVVFWGPLSWTLIFGLIFAFFMTLLIVPSMYLISERLRRPMTKFYGTKWVALLGFTGPLFFLLVLIMWIWKRLVQGKPMLPHYLGFKTKR
ncbi:MAG: efflux RND transporter permease subunit [Sphingobacteriales bacterium]|nr:MAG: efflux RND transporter permease subunit [Sphingobacteriales bacterium]